MKRLTIAACSLWLGVAGSAFAQPPAESSAANGWNSPVKSVASPSWNPPETTPAAMPPSEVPAATLAAPTAAPMTAPAATAPAMSSPTATAPAAAAPPTGSPGEGQASREVRAHERYLMETEAQAEWIRRAAVARADQRNRRLESQRWFGLSNTRPNVNPDPFDGDYAPSWASNDTFNPMRWLGGGSPWGYAESQ